MQLKKFKGTNQVDTYHSLGAVKYNTIENIPLIATQRLAVEKEVLEIAKRLWRRVRRKSNICDRIEEIVNELGMSHFTTLSCRLSQDILPTYYAAGDVCVVPSYYKPFGLVA